MNFSCSTNVATIAKSVNDDDRVLDDRRESARARDRRGAGSPARATRKWIEGEREEELVDRNGERSCESGCSRPDSASAALMPMTDGDSGDREADPAPDHAVRRDQPDCGRKANEHQAGQDLRRERAGKSAHVGVAQLSLPSFLNAAMSARRDLDGDHRRVRAALGVALGDRRPSARPSRWSRRTSSRRCRRPPPMSLPRPNPFFFLPSSARSWSSPFLLLLPSLSWRRSSWLAGAAGQARGPFATVATAASGTGL